MDWLKIRGQGHFTEGELYQYVRLHPFKDFVDITQFANANTIDDLHLSKCQDCFDRAARAQWMMPEVILEYAALEIDRIEDAPRAVTITDFYSYGSGFDPQDLPLNMQPKRPR